MWAPRRSVSLSNVKWWPQKARYSNLGECLAVHILVGEAWAEVMTSCGMFTTSVPATIRVRFADRVIGDKTCFWPVLMPGTWLVQNAVCLAPTFPNHVMAPQLRFRKIYPFFANHVLMVHKCDTLKPRSQNAFASKWALIPRGHLEFTSDRPCVYHCYQSPRRYSKCYLLNSFLSVITIFPFVFTTGGQEKERGWICSA